MRPARSRAREKSKPELYLVGGTNAAKPKPIRRKCPRWARIVLTGLGLYMLSLFALSGYEIWKLKQQIRDLEQEQNRIIQQQHQLKQELQSLHDPEMIEKIARESLGMVRQGETIVIPAIPGYDIPKPKSVVPGEITH